MRRLLPVVLLVLVAVEVVLLAWVARELGILATLGLLLAGALAGSLVVRHQGRAAWRRLRAEAEAGRPPAAEAADGALLLLGGALLVVPGFLGDLVGIVLLVPPVRRLLRRTVLRGPLERMARPGPLGPAFVAGFPGAAGGAWSAGAPGGGRPRADGGPADVEGTATAHEPDADDAGAAPRGALGDGPAG